MEPIELMEPLLELANEVGLEVRIVRQSLGGELETDPTSAVCRIRGQTCVMINRQDPVEFQNRILASGLIDHAGAELEQRYLPPAVRAFLEELEHSGFAPG
jgi:hypothetical protein